MDRYLVIGHPVRHSLSPRIHARFAELTGQALVYDRLEAPLDGFAATVRALFDDGLSGANVTVPFKGDARDFADVLDPDAERAGAVNTLRREADGRISGHNTDGAGLVRDLSVNLALTLRGARVGLVGAGGAAAGVLGPLLAAGVGELVLANRTPERAEILARRFAGDGPLRTMRLDALPRVDLLVNATAASLGGEVPALPAGCVDADSVAYDMMYSDDGTPFLGWCAERGVRRRADGLGMLVEQAAEAFALWRGVRPDTADVLAMLRCPPRSG